MHNTENNSKPETTTSTSARKQARYDIPVLRPSMPRAKIVRLLRQS